MKLSIASDHAAFELKFFIAEYLKKGHEVIDFGPESPERSVDYPDFARRVCKSVLSGETEFGILLCGTGIGMSMAANKYRGIRAALCLFPEMAALARKHNHANVLVLGGRLMGSELAAWTVDTFLSTVQEGGRHTRRVEKIESLPVEDLERSK
ncbi:MAG TPA: ribose 5-phosphate isomerase B [Mesotoga sp.]|jgi:ribose 5-phosphate isomerase B|nr:ribose 5-phosphate isomerase B [Mesotoga infera]HNS67659.1 ribose 5-phosphate isomerase B [Mesotoga infera]HPB64899.1 ribose 5-phosphate isomerase B [Mesotoga sp.]HQQ56885.1 ribose 5-phosphate isomerase B [Mesotoga sp.]